MTLVDFDTTRPRSAGSRRMTNCSAAWRSSAIVPVMLPLVSSMTTTEIGWMLLSK